MIGRFASRVSLPLGAMRARAASSVERAEARLEMACTWGAGHLLVTGADRADARDLLERVLRRIDPFGTVRARACDPNPESALDGLFALSAGDGRLPLDRRERRHALLRLLERARAARRSVFIVVDDGDDATVAQLERLRAGVEVAPEALERLRLVFLGGSALVAKLDDCAARALRSRITSRIRVDTHRGATVLRSASRAAAGDTPVPRSVAIAAGASFALLAYAAAQLVLAPAGERREMSVVDARSTRPRSDAPVVQARTGMRGDEPFIGGGLRIPIQAKWTTGSALFPPPTPVVETAAVAPSAPAPQSDPPAPNHVAPVVATARPPAPAKMAAELAAGSSIAALVARFR
jgi:hypothetical protein